MKALGTKIIKRAGLILLIPIVIFSVYLLYMIFTDYRPDQMIELPIETNQDGILKKNAPISILTYNIGYGGLDKNQDFFLDGGTGSRSQSKEKTIENIKGIAAFLKEQKPDFIMFQEIDRKSTRSNKVDEVHYMQENLEGYASSFALNYKVAWVPVPLTKPHGAVEGGILTLSRYKINSSIRHQLPGSEAFFRQLADLDRCIQENRISVEGGKELVLINAHLSAYDEGGKVRKQQLEYLQGYIQKEYDKGNYVVVGGDWNHVLPGTDPLNFKTTLEYPSWLQTMPTDFAPQGFNWAVDGTIPTNRSVDRPYEKGVNFLCTIDGFLISPNVEIKTTMGYDLNFEFTDHNPVRTEIILK